MFVLPAWGESVRSSVYELAGPCFCKGSNDDHFRELLDELLKGCERPEDLLGDAGLIKELKIGLMELMLGVELAAHLGYEDGKDAPPEQLEPAERFLVQDAEGPGRRAADFRSTIEASSD